MRLRLVQINGLMVLLSLLVALTGCSDTTGNTTPTDNLTASATNIASTRAAKTSKIGSEWWQGIPCEIPCWEGIVPGHTTREQALDLLQRNSLVAQINNDTSETGTLTWQGFGDLNAPFGVLDYNYDAVSKDPAIVYSIFIYTSSYNLKLSEVIQTLGTPTYVATRTGEKQNVNNPSEFTTTYSFSVVYLNKGLELSSEYSDQPPLLNGDLTFNNPLFFAPGPDGYNTAHHINGGVADLAVWQGFKDYNFYCTNTSSAQKSGCPGQK